MAAYPHAAKYARIIKILKLMKRAKLAIALLFGYGVVLVTNGIDVHLYFTPELAAGTGLIAFAICALILL